MAIIGNSLFIGNNVEWTALDAEKDAAEISKWTLDLEVSYDLFDRSVGPFAIHEIKNKLKEELKNANEKRRTYIFALRRTGSQELIGLIRFCWYLPTHQGAQLSLNFSSNEVMKELGEEVLKMALRYGFMEMSLHRIWIELPGFCAEKIHLFEEAGFIREVQRREASFFNGRFYDQVGYAMLKPEWKKTQHNEVII